MQGLCRDRIPLRRGHAAMLCEPAGLPVRGLDHVGHGGSAFHIKGLVRDLQLGICDRCGKGADQRCAGLGKPGCFGRKPEYRDKLPLGVGPVRHEFRARPECVADLPGRCNRTETQQGDRNLASAHVLGGL